MLIDNAHFIELLSRLSNVIPVFVAVAAVISTLIGALASGILRRLRFGSIEIESGVDRNAIERIRHELAESKQGAPIPFEIEQLANYYSLTLGQSRISFWFSLIFASIGFLVIVGAAVLYREGDYASASIKIVSGLVIDAVAALFFVQSRRAQESMSAFFEKLRSDRQYVEARKVCDEISDVHIRDRLKTILVLHYSGLGPDQLIGVLATELGERSSKAQGAQAPRGTDSAPI